MQKFMRIGMPTVMFAVMSQQPAGVALYVLSSSTISTMTAALLRNPSFRSMTNMSPLPSKESEAVWTKVARGEVKLHDVIDAKGNIIYKPQPTYQSPTRTAPKTIEVKSKTPKSQHAGNKPQQRGLNIQSQHPTGLNIKSSTAALPTHLVSPSSLTEIDPAQRDRDDDFTAGPSPGIRNQVDWVWRNYNPTFVYRRLRNWIWENPEIQMKIRKREREMEIKRKKEEESRRGGRR
jgi:YidC/Oxa1 family membrane protein insertase